MTVDYDRCSCNSPPAVVARVGFSLNTIDINVFRRLRDRVLKWQCSYMPVANNVNVIRRMRKHDSEFTADRNRSWRNSRCWNHVRSGTMVYCFEQINRYNKPRKSFLILRLIFINWDVFTAYQYRTRTGIYLVSSIICSGQSLISLNFPTWK